MNETKTLTVSEFLKERLREEEAMAQAAIADDGGQDGGFEDEFDRLTRGRKLAGTLAFEPSFGEACARMIVWNTPRRVLEDIMSKRAIVDLHQHVTDPAGWIDCVTCGEQGDAIHRPHAACAHLRLLAAPYRNHPQWREEWA